MRIHPTARAMAAFSLVEVLCAILILGVALVGLSQAVAVALQSNKESEQQTTAALIAAGRVETLRAEGGLEDGEEEGECEGALSAYRWKQSLTRTGIEGLHEVSVEVENAKTGKAIYELRTMLFEAPDELTPAENRGRPTTKSRKRARLAVAKPEGRRPKSDLSSVAVLRRVERSPKAQIRKVLLAATKLSSGCLEGRNR